MLKGFRDSIRRYFTRTVLLSERAEIDAASKARTRSRRRRSVQVQPSERFVWGMVLLIIALVGVIVLEAVCIVVTGAVNSELLSVITGLVGALVSAFVVGKKG